VSAPKFDCAIVGAGPAGSATAFHLARNGVAVVLLDRADFPRSKPCGDCISPGANGLLERLGVLSDVQRQAAALDGWRIYAPNGTFFETRFDRVTADPLYRQAYAIDRRRLDALLLRAARNAGAHVLTRAHVTDIRDEATFHRVYYRDSDHSPRELRCRFLIGADGLRSIISRRTGLVGRAARLRKLSLTAHAAAISGIANHGELHVIDGATLGVAPIETGSNDLPACNVTLVAASPKFARDAAADTRQFFLRRVRSFPGVRDRIVREDFGELLGSGPFDRPVRSVVAPGVALVGDAAGYFDPFTGQGLYQALATAERLADCVNRAFRAGSPRAPLHDYVREHARIVNGNRRLQRIIDNVCARPALMNRAVRALYGAPNAAERLTGVTGDLLPVRCLLSPPLVFTFFTRFFTSETRSAHHR